MARPPHRGAQGACARALCLHAQSLLQLPWCLSFCSRRGSVHAPTAEISWIGAGFAPGTQIACIEALGIENNDGGGVAVETSTNGLEWTSVYGDGDTTEDTFTILQQCSSISAVADDAWCSINCNHSPPFCPSDICVCV